MEKSRLILKHHWGFDQFRPLQEDIVDDAINGFDVLALLPTGGGKSICFQVPGIAREGLTLVVSPLIALMQDQVYQLKSRGIQAELLISGMSLREIDVLLDNCKFGNIKFLYTSPERLGSTLFLERFKQMQIGLIVVDEAHCISEWGHDFRPAFLEIAKLRNYFPEVPMMALTATATQEVQNDIIVQLGLKKPKVHQASFVRKNLSYQVEKSNQKTTSIVHYLEGKKGQCGIIYAQTRKSVKQITQYLHQLKFKVGIYHGGMTKEDREIMLKSWLSGEIEIMVATNAFGMGIDKPNVRFVIHAEFPSSLEAYFQEAGRGGRDGLEAEAILFYQEKEIEDHRLKIKFEFPPKEEILKVYRGLCNYLKIAFGSGNQETFSLDVTHFIHTFQLDPKITNAALKILQLNQTLSISESIQYKHKIQMLIGNPVLYNFQIKHPNLSPLISTLSRSYPGIYDYFIEINEAAILKQLQINEATLEKQLEFLEQYGVIDIHWKSKLPKITFLIDRHQNDQLVIQEKVYSNRLKRMQDKLDAMIGFLENNACRPQQIIAYFGQKSEACGKCDVCLASDSYKSHVNLESAILTVLKKEGKLTLEAIQQHFPKIAIEQTLQKLLMSEQIKKQDDQFFSLS